MNKARCLLLFTACFLVMQGFTVFGADIDDSVYGYYTENGYINEYFDFRVDLPDGYSLVYRSADFPEQGKVVEDANSRETFNKMREDNEKSGHSKIFHAFGNSDNIIVNLFNADHQFAELNGAENGLFKEEDILAAEERESCTSAYESRSDIEDLKTGVDFSDGFLGGRHYAALIKYRWIDSDGEGHDRNEIRIMLRSGDGEYLCKILLTSDDAYHMESLCSYFSQYLESTGFQPSYEQGSGAEEGAVEASDSSVEGEDSGLYYIVTDSYVDETSANERAAELKEQGIEVQIKSYAGMYRVISGVFEIMDFAQKRVMDLEEKGINAKMFRW